ncbi:helix-turn-helix domain-containing protein [Streptomyces peucetius]|nr:transcriptional regulator [Streptomyces peucetius subsp. caesius ATCC 27952]
MDQLGEFLRSRRARVSPQSLGLRGGARRRVPGLRREELAQLAGISVEYYQRLEQGRAANPSTEVLDAIATALSLDEVERAHLGTLAHPVRGRDARAAAEVRSELRRMLDLMERIPALVINDRFDLLAANRLASELFPEVANLALYLFLDPAARSLYLEWSDVAAATAAQLRLTAARYPADRELTALIEELKRSSDAFDTYWASGDVEIRSSGTKRLRHPSAGVLTLSYENFDAPGDPRQRLVAFTAEPGSPTDAALQLLTTRPTIDS